MSTPTPSPVEIVAARSVPPPRSGTPTGATIRAHARRWAVGLVALTAVLASVLWRSRDKVVPAVANRWASAPWHALAAHLGSFEWPSMAMLHPRPPEVSRADARLRHDGHESVPGGIVFFPSTFESADGGYDLYVHFHGNTGVVRESAESAGVDAIVTVINLGVGSAPYEDAYAVPGTYEALLDDIQHAVEKRHLTNAHRNRVALGSWSAGYGAIQTILEVRKGVERLDAILVTDGIHCGWLDEGHSTLNGRQLAPWVRAARSAAAGEMFFAITHSFVEPIGYASARDTAKYLLDAVGAERHAPEVPELPHLALKSAEGAVAKKLEKHMEPVEEARMGGLHVRGFRGNTPEHHMAHLLQMGATVMPELASHWKKN